MPKFIVTSYVNPDLDGVGAGVGYAELLRAQNKEAVAAFTGTPLFETQWLLERFRLPPLTNFKTIHSPDDHIVLVDTSGETELDATIQDEKVIEIIDHRSAGDPHIRFPNATLQIELIGAVATLVAERMANAHIFPSHEAALLLLDGIVSNTMNFCSPNTTDRDHIMYEWLLPIADVDSTFPQKLFSAKTKLTLDNLEEALRADGLSITVDGTVLTQAQLEIIDAPSVLNNRRDELEQVVVAMKKEGGAQYALLNCIDLGAKTTDILVFDQTSEEFYTRALGVSFKNGHAHIDHIFLRKQMLPLIRQALNEKSAF